MGKDIRTLGQETKKKPKSVPVKDLKNCVDDIMVQAEELLAHDGFKHDGDEHHPLSIAKRTVESVISRLKTASGYL